MGFVDWKAMHECEFKPDQREMALDAELEKYYKNTMDCDNRIAAGHWKVFASWCSLGGYTVNEINRAKRRVTDRLKI